MMVCIVASIIIGFLSWYFIEKPFRSKDRFSRKSIFILGFFALGAMFAIGAFGMVKNKIFPETNPAILKIQKHAVNLQPTVRDCDDKIHDFCTIGDKSKIPNILLWGLDQNVEIYNINGETVTPETAIRNTVQYFRNKGKRVIVTYPIPEMGWNVPKKLPRQIKARKEPDGSILYDVFKNYNQTSFDILDNLVDVERIYPHEILCNQTRCRAITDDGTPLYFDDDHISPYAAKIISKTFKF